MSEFVRQNWLYIAAPLALILLGLVVFLLFFADGAAGSGVYTIF